MRKAKFWRTRVLCCLMAVVMMVAMCGCGSSTKPEEHKNDAAAQKTEAKEQVPEAVSGKTFAVTINGSTVELPCTLADLNAIGLDVRDFFKQQIFPTSGEEFLMVSVMPFDGENYGAVSVEVKIVTGDNPDAGAENAIIQVINNTTMDAGMFSMKNGIGLGATIDDVIAAYGEPEDILAARDDRNVGTTLLYYGDMSDGAVLMFKDGSLKDIQIEGK